MVTALMTRKNRRKITWNREKVPRSVQKTLRRMIIAALKWTIRTIVFIGNDKTKWRKVNCSTHIRRGWQNNLITEEILHSTVQQTNHCILIRPNFSRENDMKRTDKIEITVICLLYLAGTLRSDKERQEELWGTDGDEIEQCRLMMNQRCFRFLIRCYLDSIN